MSMYLTPAEIQQLTGHKTRPSAQRWLDRNHWAYAMPGGSGWPLVLRQYHDGRMSGIVTPHASRQKAEPNWTAA